MKITPAPATLAPRMQPTLSPGQEFEAMVLGRMVDDMLSTIDLGAFGGGHAEETWRSFLSEAIGQSLAEQGRTGIAAQVEATIARYREGSRT